MNILVLDSIHGGDTLSRHLRKSGHHVDVVDIYRGESGITQKKALEKKYDTIIAPVHLDPDHPLMNVPGATYCSHHDAVEHILKGHTPSPMIEITGAQGKTTTAYAIAHLMKGVGVLHTSGGTWEYPQKTLLWKKSITPASTIDAAFHAANLGGWLITEESLGVSGAGDVCVLTSPGDYAIAGGKKSAFTEKVRLLSKCRIVVVGPDIKLPFDNSIYADEVVSVSHNTCRFSWKGTEGEFENPLLALEGYRNALMTAATVACVISVDPTPLGEFTALPGRLKTELRNDILIIDNANSGTNVHTTVEAARYARELSGCNDLTLVIGAEAQNICEGFPLDTIISAIRKIKPGKTIIVGFSPTDINQITDIVKATENADNLEEGLSMALASTKKGSIVLAVKTWR
jgi:UDP-N-acetylmuramyl pentapeptide synthase